MRNYLWFTIIGYPKDCSTPTLSNVTNDSKAFAKIWSTVDSAAITHVISRGVAVFEYAFEDNGMGRRLPLQRKLYRLSLSDFVVIEVFINAVLSTAQICRTLARRSILRLLQPHLYLLWPPGHSPKYESLIMALENCNIDVNTDLLRTRLLNEISNI